MKTAVAIRHVHFEDLGTFRLSLESAGYDVRYHDIGQHDSPLPDALQDDLVIVLGAPVGVYECGAYPFLTQELDLLNRRVTANRPTLGICLGAQLIAAAAGAAVYPSGIKEIGFSPITLTESGRASVLRHLGEAPVLHWHGDTFDIPNGAQHLASTRLCRHQAFAIGNNILALQFHPEFDVSSGLERWLIGHAAELAAAKISPASLRAQAIEHGFVLRDTARVMISQWLTGLS